MISTHIAPLPAPLQDVVETFATTGIRAVEFGPETTDSNDVS